LKEGKNPNWYPECIRLEDIEGLKAYTFGGYIKKDENRLVVFPLS
jgi:hypothetical protein